MTAPSVTVVVPTYNRREDLRRCLESVSGQRGVAVEIIVVDDGGDDGTAEMVRAEFLEARLIRTPRRLGPGYARNVAIREARSALLLFLDSDSRLRSSGTLERAVAFFETHPDAGSAGGEIPAYGSRRGRLFGRSIRFNGDSADLECPLTEGAECECDFLATCGCFVRRDVVVGVGGFDPHFGYGGEDKDLGFRIRAAGHRNHVAADLAAEHHHSATGRSSDETYRFQRTRFEFLCKNAGVATVLTAAAYWACVAIAFHLALPLKGLSALLRRRRPGREQLLGGWMLLRAMTVTLAAWPAIRRRRGVDHLAPRAMDACLEPSNR